MYRDPALNSAAFIQQSCGQREVGGCPAIRAVQEWGRRADIRCRVLHGQCAPKNPAKASSVRVMASSSTSRWVTSRSVGR